MNIYAITALIGSLSSLFLGIFVYSKNRNRPINKSFGLLSISIFIWVFGCFRESSVTTRESALMWDRFLYTGAVFAPTFFSHFSLIVAEKKKKLTIRILYVISFLFLGFNLLPNLRGLFIVDVQHKFIFRYIAVPGVIWYLYFIYFAFCGLYAFYTLAKTLTEEISGHKKEQLKYMILSLAIIFIAAGMYLALVFSVATPPIDNLLVAVFSFITAYSIIKYRLMDIKVAITRTGIFIAVYTLVLGVPFAISTWGKASFIELLGPNWWMIPLILMAVFATVGPFIYIYIEGRAEGALLKEQRRYQQTLKHASVGMTRIRNLRKLLDLITHIVVKSVRISYVAVYLYDEQENAYVLQLSRDKGRIPLSSMAVNNPLIAYLIHKRDPLIYEEVKRQMLEDRNKTFKSLEQNMELLTASVIIPSFLEDKLMGFFVLGDKISGQIYTVDDLNVFQVLASQAALAIENAKFYEETKALHEQISQAEKMATIGTMADGLSHQINNRFYALSLIASDTVDTIKLTDTTSCTPEVRQMITDVNHALERIQANVMQGGEVVRGMLKYTRRGEEGFEPLELNKLLDNTLEMVQFKVRVSELDIIRDFNHIPKIKGNMTQLEEAFFNFIDNANDAIAERKLLLKEPGYKGRITISAKQKTDDMLEIIVEDNGMGVKDPDAKKVFTPFFTTKISSRKGTGLGLYVIKRIITEIHNGKISFESVHKVGTRFIIELPIAKG